MNKEIIMATTSVNVPVEYIKLVRAYLEAVKAGLHSQKDFRRAESLRQQLDAKTLGIEKVIAATEKPVTEEAPIKLL
jgi:hypothetical protein